MYTGNRCDIRVRSCLSSPCKYGQCVEDLLTGAYICNCPVGLTGTNCDQTIDTCASNPCLNQATCAQTRPYTFECACKPGYTGTLCETRIDFCQSYPCFNQGKCFMPNVNSWACNCSSEFTGLRCEKYVSSSCLNNTCNGNGFCVSIGTLTKCVCLPGYTGPECQLQINPCSSSPCQEGICLSNGAVSWTCVCPPGMQQQK